MDTSKIRVQVAQRVNDLLHSDAARRHLMTYGWVEGMPVVFASPTELVDDVMGLVGVHGRAVLLAVHSEHTDEFVLWHVTIPSPIFNRVPALGAATTLADLCVRSAKNRLIAFRVSFWTHSASIHEIPCFVSNDRNLAANPSLSNKR